MSRRHFKLYKWELDALDFSVSGCRIGSGAIERGEDAEIGLLYFFDESSIQRIQLLISRHDVLRLKNLLDEVLGDWVG